MRSAKLESIWIFKKGFDGFSFVGSSHRDYIITHYRLSKAAKPPGSDEDIDGRSSKTNVSEHLTEWKYHQELTKRAAAIVAMLILRLNLKYCKRKKQN